MTRTIRCRFGTLLCVAASLGACSPSSPRTNGEMLGYGTPGVSAYVSGDNDASLQAQLARCDQVPQAGSASQTQGLPAACGQLRRTLRSQPGNSVQPGSTR